MKKIHTILRRALAFIAMLIVLLTASTAWACWDGYRIQTERWVVRGGEETWSPERMQRFAAWSARIERLLPADACVTVEWGMVTIESERLSLDFEWDSESGDEGLFEAIALEVGASVEEIEEARALAPRRFFTVDVFASPDRTQAQAQADALNVSDALDRTRHALYGAYETGGFPASNDFAHVIEGKEGDLEAFRVVIGAFEQMSEARAALRALQAAGEGSRAFVRWL